MNEKNSPSSFILTPLKRYVDKELIPEEIRDDYGTEEHILEHRKNNLEYDPYRVACLLSQLETFIRPHFQYTGIALIDRNIEDHYVATVEFLNMNMKPIQLKQTEIDEIQNIVNDIVSMNEPDGYIILDLLNQHYLHPTIFQSIVQFLKMEDENGDEIEIKILQDRYVFVYLSEYLNHTEIIQYIYNHMMLWIQDVFQQYIQPSIQNENITMDNIENLLNRAFGFPEMETADPTMRFEMIKEDENESINESIFDFDTYILKFSNTNPLFDPLNNEIGETLLASMKQFSGAEHVEFKPIGFGEYSFVLMKNQKPIQFEIEFTKIFGYQYFTDDCRGLLVVKENEMLLDMMQIKEFKSGRIGIFVPIYFRQNRVNMNELLLQLENYKSTVDFYSLDESEIINNRVQQFNLEYMGMIDNYIFVRKDYFLTQNLIRRTIQEDFPSMIIWIPKTDVNSNFMNIVELLVKEYPYVPEELKKELFKFKYNGSLLNIPVIDRKYIQMLFQFIYTTATESLEVGG